MVAPDEVPEGRDAGAARGSDGVRDGVGEAGAGETNLPCVWAAGGGSGAPGSISAGNDSS